MKIYFAVSHTEKTIATVAVVGGFALRTIQVAVACVALIVLVPQVDAAINTWDVLWSGSSYSNSATANGTISFDDTLLPTPVR